MKKHLKEVKKKEVKEVKVGKKKEEAKIEKKPIKEVMENKKEVIKEVPAAKGVPVVVESDKDKVERLKAVLINFRDNVVHGSQNHVDEINRALNQ